MSRYIFYTLLALFFQGLFAFFEMACVSFSKVRLQYYVSQNSKRALWLNYLLQRPSRLFGTTIFGITTSLIIGSECSRRVYESLGLNPDLAFITQVPLVVIFAELAPLFAARKHPEQSAMALVPFMIFLSRILTPITWTFDLLSHGVHRLMGKEVEAPLFLSQEEVRAAFEEQDGNKDEFHTTTAEIFKLKNLNAAQLMIPIAQAKLIPSHSTLADVKHSLSVHYIPIFPIYHRYSHNIVAVAQLRDLLRLNETQKVLDVAKSPWFITKDTSILQLLQQFRRNNQNLAVILDASGLAVGFLTLDQILDKIFGEEQTGKEAPQVCNYIDRTLPGDMTVADFNRQFSANLPDRGETTLSDFILDVLGHLPVKDESIKVDHLEFTVDEPTLQGIKTVLVRSLRE
jgi:putative hemolysin